MRALIVAHGCGGGPRMVVTNRGFFFVTWFVCFVALIVSEQKQQHFVKVMLWCLRTGGICYKVLVLGVAN